MRFVSEQVRRARSRLPAALAVSLAVLAGCASTQLDAQWTDPALKNGTPLRGARVLVACEARESVFKRLCEDRLAAEVGSRGAVAIVAADPGLASPETRAQAARDAGAVAVLVVQVVPEASRRSAPFSIGIGGFGIGGGGVAGGVGVSLPVGGDRIETGHAANGSLTRVSTGSLMWTGRASTPPSRDMEAQLNELVKALVDGAAGAGVF